MTDIVVAGHLCLDIIPIIPLGSPSPLISPGRLTEVGQAVVSTGGAVSNVGLAAHRLGLDTRLVGRVGDDPIGALVRQVLSADDASLGNDLITAAGEASSYSLVINPPGIDRAFLHCPGTNDTFGPDDLPLELLREARLFHFGYPPLMRRMYANGGLELAELLRRAKATGATVSLDTSMPDASRDSGQADWPLILSRALPQVQLFVPSIEELLYMLDRPAYDALLAEAGAAGMIEAMDPEVPRRLAQQCLALGAQVVFIKMGHRGAYLRTAGELELGRAAPAMSAHWANRELWAPCFSVEVRGTVGSGDTTITGFLAGLLHGVTAEQALTMAVAVGACSVETPDPTSGILPWEETAARVAAGWPRLDAGLQGSGFCYDEITGLWQGPADG